jgi:hypothetical protein
MEYILWDLDPVSGLYGHRPHACEEKNKQGT